MINKPTIIISSLGRTGTNFFADFFQTIFTDTVSLHEPDVIVINSKKIKIKESIKYAGWRASVFNKIINAEDIKSLSKKRLEKKINRADAAKKIVKLRKNLIHKCESTLYVESNYRFHGLLDVLPYSFSNFKSIYIIRDPRDWVRSFSNYIGLYHWSDIHSYLNGRISAYSVGKMGKKNWRKTKRFEKLAWAWNYINSYALCSIKNTANCRLVKFEDIFSSPDKVKNTLEIINYLSQIKDCPPFKKNYQQITKALLSKKINKSLYSNTPKWTKWSKDQAQIIDRHCGDLMHKLGYGKENTWKNLIK